MLLRNGGTPGNSEPAVDASEVVALDALRQRSWIAAELCLHDLQVSRAAAQTDRDIIAAGCVDSQSVSADRRDGAADSLTFRRGEGQPRTKHWTISAEGMSAVCSHFPHPVHQVYGTVEVETWAVQKSWVRMPSPR